MEHENTDEHNKSLLTVRKLMEFLSTCNPDANIVAFEINSNAYTQQFPNLPNQYICTVAEDKKNEREYATRWYKGVWNAEKKVEEHMKDLYRYVNDDDVVFRLGNT